MVWLLVDQATKAFCESFGVGTVIAGPFFGVFDLALVHNTGAAWGMFGDMTLVLAVLSLVVCVAAALYLFLFVPDSSALCAVGLSLVVAGGIGNAIDRFANMYVIDFIRPVCHRLPGVQRRRHRGHVRLRALHRVASRRLAQERRGRLTMGRSVCNVAGREHEGMRLDAFCAELGLYASRSAAAKAVGEGSVLVNGSVSQKIAGCLLRVTPSYASFLTTR